MHNVSVAQMWYDELRVNAVLPVRLQADCHALLFCFFLSSNMKVSVTHHRSWLSCTHLNVSSRYKIYTARPGAHRKHSTYILSEMENFVIPGLFALKLGSTRHISIIMAFYIATWRAQCSDLIHLLPPSNHRPNDFPPIFPSCPLSFNFDPCFCYQSWFSLRFPKGSRR